MNLKQLGPMIGIALLISLMVAFTFSTCSDLITQKKMTIYHVKTNKPMYYFESKPDVYYQFDDNILLVDPKSIEFYKDHFDSVEVQ